MVEPATEPNFVATLGLNWKLFLAQAVNFAVVVFVLWRWVFRPVAGALEARRQRIEGSVKKAAEIEDRLTALSAEETAKLKAARAEGERLITEASEAAAAAKAETIAAAKTEAEKVMRQALAAVAAEKDKALREIRAEVAELVVLGTEKILRAKLDEKKDRELIENALKNVIASEAKQSH